MCVCVCVCVCGVCVVGRSNEVGKKELSLMINFIKQ